MFFKKKQIKKTYDKDNLRPVLKCSICNGEQVAGFENIHTGKFEEVSLIHGTVDLQEFMQMYDLNEVPKKIY